MSCAAELIRGIQITNPGIAGVGSAVNLESLFAANAAKTFDEVTVYNDTDRTVMVSYTNDSTGESDFFLLPNGGKSFTHKLSVGSISTPSMKVYSINNVIATGVVTINLSKSR